MERTRESKGWGGIKSKTCCYQRTYTLSSQQQSSCHVLLSLITLFSVQTIIFLFLSSNEQNQSLFQACWANVSSWGHSFTFLSVTSLFEILIMMNRWWWSRRSCSDWERKEGKISLSVFAIFDTHRKEWKETDNDFHYHSRHLAKSKHSWWCPGGEFVLIKLYW